jgi:serine protease Do
MASALLGARPRDYNERTMTPIARRATAAAATALSLLLGPMRVAAEELPDIADRVQASVVSITAERTDQTPAPQATGDKDQDADAAKSNLRQGSGMVLWADGYIVTATSLVDKVGKITVVFSDGKQASAQVTGRDPRTGIALLKASGTAPLTAIHLGDAHIMRRGASVFSIGNAYNMQNSLSAGVIAAIRRSGGPLPHLVLQTDIVVHPGSTGAPLFNMKGEVIGMFTSNYSNAGKRTGIGLAVTSNVIKDVAEKLQKSGVVDRGWLGVQVRKTTDEEAGALSIEKGGGLMLLKTVEGGPAATSGLVAGDVITSINGQAMRDVVPFAWAVANQASNTDVTLGVVRKSGHSDLHVKLGRMPDPQTATSSSSPAAPGTTPGDNKGLACLRYVPSVGMTVAVACEE